MQMLGPRMDKPADLVVAYTPKGQVTGGTGQALRMAGNLGIPVRNLGDPAVLASVRRYLATAPQPSGGTFEIVASRGPQANYDILGMRARGQTMATVQSPGEPGWLGNPYVADDAGGRYTRQQATDMFRALVEEKGKDPAWRDAFLGLAGKKLATTSLLSQQFICTPFRTGLPKTPKNFRQKFSDHAQGAPNK